MDRSDGNRSVTHSADPLPLLLHVFPTFTVGGAQARFVSIANRLGTEFEHAILALDGRFDASRGLSPDLRVRYIQPEGQKASMLVSAFRYRKNLHAWRPDLVLTYNWGAIEYALANLVPVVPGVHVIDGFGPEEQSRPLRRRVLVRRVALARRIVVVPSVSLVKLATEDWRLSRDLVRYMPNGVDLKRFRPRDPASAPNDVPVIGTVAALRPEKNIARLIHAFAQLLPSHPARLVIVGSGGMQADLVTLTERLGIRAHVEFTGHSDNAEAHYARFDIFALSSDTEQMPLSVLEAMGTGLPIVSTDVGDVRAMVAPENLPHIRTPSISGLYDSLLTLLRDPAQRKALGQANRARSERDFSQEAMFGSWRALFLEHVRSAR